MYRFLIAGLLAVAPLYFLVERIGAAIGISPLVGRGKSIELQSLAGAVLTYSFKRAIVLNGPFGSQEIDYQGELRIAILRSDESGFRAGAGVRLEGEPWQEAPQIEVEGAFDGESLRVFAQDRQRTSVLKDLIAIWSFDLREDTVGRYLASTHTERDILGRTWHKKIKHHYLEAREARPQIVESVEWMRLAPDGAVPQEIRLNEVTRMPVPWGGEAMSTRSQAEIRLLSIRKPASVLPRNAADWYREESLAVVLAPEHEAASQVRVQESGEAEGDPLRALGEWTEALRRDRSRALSALAALVRESEDPLGFRNVVGALASEGSEESQRELLSLYDSKGGEDSRQRVILNALTMAPNPVHPSVRRELLDLMETETRPDLIRGVGYALGASLRNAPVDSQLSETLEHIHARWRKLATKGGLEREKLDLLDMMGNSGRPEFLPELTEVIDDLDAAPRVRARAVFALRWIRSASAEVEAVLERADGDADPEVRRAVSETRGFRSAGS